MQVSSAACLMSCTLYISACLPSAGMLTINAHHGMHADNFHSLTSNFPQLNNSLGSFAQHSLHALSQHAFSQQALQQRSISLPQRLGPQTGLYDTHPTSLLEALRQHGHPKPLMNHLEQQQQHQQPGHQMHPAALHQSRIESLRHELPDREASDASLSGMMLVQLARLAVTHACMMCMPDAAIHSSCQFPHQFCSITCKHRDSTRWKEAARLPHGIAYLDMSPQNCPQCNGHTLVQHVALWKAWITN